MNRQDLVAQEITIAVAYEREARRRRSKNPAIADQLISWADASRIRAARLRCGPLFGGSE